MHYHGRTVLWKNLIQQSLHEDGWPWDWTTLGTLKSPEARVRAKVVVKSEGIWAGAGLVETLRELDAGTIVSKLKDGDRLRIGEIAVHWRGPARAVLGLERSFLNLAGYASGIATQTRRLVDQIQRACPKNPPRITATRKILPYYRDIAIHAVQVGGGYSHRVSLSGGVLIKENHIAAAGGIARAVKGARAVAPHGLKIEIEVRSAKELDEALVAGVDIVLLDNFSPTEVRRALQRIARAPVRPVVEVSGGLNERNISDYALEGVDILSLGSLTHSVRAVDLSLLVESHGR